MILEYAWTTMLEIGSNSWFKFKEKEDSKKNNCILMTLNSVTIE